ncbi:MAG: hypothetical protein ABR505_12380 [Actinomycetota bacterium]
MADEKPPQETPPPSGSETEAPPLDPDPRLITYLERGRKPGEPTARIEEKSDDDGR